MFISFEGIDGSSKSTQAAVLVDALRRGGRNVRYVREPGGTELGERVRSLLLEGGSVAPMAELLLFSAARAQLVADVVRPALQAGEIVVADRFFDSTTAYQGGGRGLESCSRRPGFWRQLVVERVAAAGRRGRGPGLGALCR